MKLLLDENLSDRIVPKIVDLFPDSSHVKVHGLYQTDDAVTWAFVQSTIISKDSGFHPRSLYSTEAHRSLSI